MQVPSDIDAIQLILGCIITVESPMSTMQYLLILLWGAYKSHEIFLCLFVPTVISNNDVPPLGSIVQLYTFS